MAAAGIVSSHCKKIGECVKSLLILFGIIASLTAYAAYPGELPKSASPITKWIFSRANACLNANNITRVAANGECLALQTYFGKTMPSPHPVLLVFIHGDGIPGGGPSDYLKYQATKFTSPNVVSVVLIRPGYYDSYDHYSTGESYAFSDHGYPNDNYRPHTVVTLAAAVKRLKDFFQTRCTILVGHSGGAMMSGIILGKYPELANGAVLASVVGNVHAWAKKHKDGDYPHSLSPDTFIDSIPKKDFVYIVSGTQDQNTYPAMSKAYYEKLKQAGIDAYWYPETGGTHNSIVLSQVKQFDNAIQDAIRECPK